MALDQDTFQQFLDTIGRFVRERMVPNEDRLEAEDHVPPEVLAEMKDIGLFALTIPEQYDGLGLGMEEEARVLFEVCLASCAYRTVFATTVGIGSQGLVIDGTEEQRQRYLPRLARGEIIGSFCLTEPNAGSDAASLRTRAVRDGDSYVINGTKRFITNAPDAGLFTVFARTNPEEKGAAGISAFLVEAGTPGLSLGKPDKKMGQRGSHTCDVIFEDCRVPTSALLGGVEGQGFKTAMKVLDRGRLHIAAASVGAAERLIRDSLTYAMDRRQFGRPIAEFQLVQAMLADSRTEAYAARCMVLDAARRRDAGENVTALASCAKLFATEMVGRVADRAVQIHGGSGYIADFKVERFYRDVRLFRLYEGTSQIQQIIIAKAMIKDAVH
ncbi:MAG: acyl-CoA dehydrogenase [Rhizobiales bacterium 24-66-13]|jgi:acyl-CoA dehydrogenase|uniref:acyl-CoA dehydrogenase family protein n=1 Tax=Roseixanthobacter finlandensis TaxID=3119922 RepID=UPI000BD8F6D8|nr:MAG: acyl-CoA dehydrogenase [Rhizobiales bacterium 35-66-30]OYZ81648.1 MAG: acyl-CoA dehydrogenase [Rhizobiales bacterium 24-66-13]OZB09097.1 MAG: acyl-CoA dehydrogenase [Rhizobiales bacterium 39-66-18]HQS09329.1 acyl-CoA dehydrogenase family protein [Xanthobacteraceae bacterium]HQS47519.1 acyl-CoA dehydrogenase family protein [Xanthobacteraceae bacterium]